MSGKLGPYLSPSADTVSTTSPLCGNDGAGTLVLFPPSRFRRRLFATVSTFRGGEAGTCTEGLGTKTGTSTPNCRFVCSPKAQMI